MSAETGRRRFLTTALALVLAVGVIAGNEPDPLAEIKELFKARKYAEAESGARSLLARVEAESGVDSVEAARVIDALVESLWRGGKAREPETRELAERAVAIKERALGSDHPDVATSLGNFGNLLWRTGDFTAARSLHERALAIREKGLGPDHPEVATSLSNIATQLYETGDYARARPLLERALAIREKAFGLEHPDVASSLNRLALVLREMADYAAARLLLERALAIREKALGPDHADVATSLNDLAIVLEAMGDYAVARPLLGRALVIGEKTLGADHPYVANTLNNLASLHFEAGDYPAARPLYERAVRIWEKVLGPDHPDVAGSLSNLAGLLAATGDFAAARPLVERALAIWEKALGPDHPDVAISLTGLASLFSDAGDYAAARPLLERALAIREKAFGPDHPDVASSLSALAVMFEDTGDYAAALPLLERSLAIIEKAQGPDGPLVAKSLNELAMLLYETGDYGAARPLLERSLAIFEKAHGPDHPIVAKCLNGLAHLRAAQGEVAGALAATLETERIAREHLRLTGRSFSERQALSYAAVRSSGLDLALTLAGRGLDDASRRSVLDAVVRSRALVFDEMAARHRATGSAADPEVARLAEVLTRARTRLANLMVRGLGDQTSEADRKLLDEAREEKELAERGLAGASAGFAREFSRGRLGVGEVASSLPPGSALVAIVRYNKVDLTPRTPMKTNATSQQVRVADLPAAGTRSAEGSAKTMDASWYLAFILRSGGQNPEVVDLGSGDEVDSLVARWRKEVSGGALRAGLGLKEAEAAYREAGTALRKRVWDPLGVAIKDSTRVFVVPDGSLNLVTLAALPVDDGGYLVERGPLVHYLSTERDLVPSGEVRRGEGILVLGSPMYDATSPFAGLAPSQGLSRPGRSAAASAARRGKRSAAPAFADRHFFRGERSTCDDFKAARFAPLSGSKREAEEVASLWKKKGAQSSMRLIGPAASEAAFKEEGPGRSVLHLATHGFFLGERCASALDSTRPSGVAAAEEPLIPRPVVGENPLLLSGLALAGANHRASAGPDEDDGVLTAEEVAAMDLSGVDWVVLSACDTGVGEYKAGEGMFGLRRAFQVAGARTVITSLWSVEDEATRAWMRNLYQERLGGASTAEAVRNASRRMIESLEHSGLPPHPYYWAGFVAVGDWK